MDEPGINSMDIVLLEMKHISGNISKLGDKLESLEGTVNTLTVQLSQMVDISRRLASLESWNGEQEKELKAITNFQGGCPRTDLDKIVNRQWAAITVLASATVVGFGTVFAFLK